jgi:DMSO/TMAO reductase YedYZ heme-binding membrane subunit
MGQVALYLMAVVALTFFIRKRIGHRWWRAIHFASFGVFFLAQIHGIWSGTDAGAPWAGALYWVSGGSLLFLAIYRLLTRPGRSHGGHNKSDKL